MNESAEPATGDRVECAAAKDPAVRTFIFAAMLLGFGAWCLTDMRVRPETWDAKHINEIAAYLLNNWGPVLLIPGGMVVLARGILFLRRKLVATAKGIGYAGRETIAWSRVSRLDATELADKGLLRLEYGPDKPLTLDSWKLTNFKAMVAFIEAHVPPEAMGSNAPDADES